MFSYILLELLARSTGCVCVTFPNQHLPVRLYPIFMKLIVLVFLCMTFRKVGLSVPVECGSVQCVNTSSGIWCLPAVLHVHYKFAVWTFIYFVF